MIKNVVLDIGNVFVRWAPLESLRAIFPDQSPEALWQTIRPDWRDLNRGVIELEAALDLFQAKTRLPREGFHLFCDDVMSKSTLIPGTDDLQARLKSAGIPLYCLSDNLKVVVDYYDKHMPFMARFDGGIVSADVGFLKPEPQIYACLLDRYRLDPATCVFFDDIETHVEGARKAGMQAFVFTDAATCERDLRSLGLSFP